MKHAYPYLEEEFRSDPIFWQWVCSLNANESPRGDFIRDTRIFRDSHDPNGAWWTRCPKRLAQGNTEAHTEYERLVWQFNCLLQQPCPDDLPTLQTWTRSLVRKLLPYSVWRHGWGGIILVNRRNEPIWAMIEDCWCPLDKPHWVWGRFDAATFYRDEDLEKYRQNPTYFVGMVTNRLTENGLQPLTTDCRDHPRATEGLVTAQRLYFEMRRQSFDDGSQRAFHEAMQHVIDQEEQ